MFKVEPSVPARERELETENVLPFVNVKVPVDEDSVKPFIVVAVAAPMFGVVKIGEVARTTLPEPVTDFSPTVAPLLYKIFPEEPPVTEVESMVMPLPPPEVSFPHTMLPEESVVNFPEFVKPEQSRADPLLLRVKFPLVPLSKIIEVEEVLLPMVIVFEFAPVPRFTLPVEPESSVRAFAPVADLIVRAPLSAMLLVVNV
jgi:hypothetical protein